MPNRNRLRIFYLSHLSKPTKDRPLYRAIHRQKARRILELGIGIGYRAVRMIEVANHGHPVGEIQFTGLDPFEARSAADGPGVTLKMAHRLLCATGARIQLIPGDPLAGLSRAANALGQFDLVVVSPRMDPRQLARVWFYVPRLLHERSEVFLERLLPGGQVSLRLVAHSEIEALAVVAAAGRRAA